MTIELPRNGRIVVIDDKAEEAAPLIRALSKKGFPVTYFTGNIEDLPEKGLPDMRIIFADISLNTEGQSDKNKFSAISSIIKKIIGEERFFYIIVVWTKHDELFDDLKEYWQNANINIKPLLILDLEKTDCIDNDGDYSVEKIESKLNDKLEDLGVLYPFMKWENIIHDSTEEIIKNFFGFYDKKLSNEDINKEILKLFNNLATAYAGKQNKTDKIINALMALGSILSDSIENKIKNTFNQEDYKFCSSSAENTDDLQIIAEINKKILIADIQSSTDVYKITPGDVFEIPLNWNFVKKHNVYDYINEETVIELFAKSKSINESEVSDKFGGRLKIKNEFKNEFKKYFKLYRNELEKKLKYVLCEVTPYCDYSQDKWKSHKLIYGIVWPYYEDHRNIIKKAEYLYQTPIFRFDNENIKIIFDFRYFTSLPFDCIDNIKPKPIFRIRQQLLVDVQSHLSRQINRPGIIFLDA